MSINRGLDWILQAQNDLQYAKDSLKLEYYSQICFVCQQASEKALKGLLFAQGVDVVKTHSVRLLAQKLHINGEILEAAQVLDLYYISARYPDGLPFGAPYQSFSKKQAVDAITYADKVIQKVVALYEQNEEKS